MGLARPGTSSAGKPVIKLTASTLPKLPTPLSRLAGVLKKYDAASANQ
jgi:hypothetical protein